MGLLSSFASGQVLVRRVPEKVVMSTPEGKGMVAFFLEQLLTEGICRKPVQVMLRGWGRLSCCR